MKLISLCVLLVTVFGSTTVAQRLVCYHTNWSRFGNDPFKVEDIDPKLCTHIVYSFFGLNDDGFVGTMDSWNDLGDEWTEGGLKKFGRLRSQNPSVKLLLGVGGWNLGPLKFQSMVRSPQKRKNFLESSLRQLKLHNLDGLEIDWIYQDSWGGTPADKAGLSDLLKEMAPKFKENRYELALATSANPRVVDNSYDLPILSANLDFINVMSYDYHGSWSLKTGHVAPLYPMATESPEQRLINVEATVRRYIALGVKPEKLNVGLVSYGRTFTLQNPNENGMNAPATGPGKIEPLPYRTFCVQDIRNIWTKKRNEEQKVPYAFAENQWVGYEDAQSLKEKVKFIKSVRAGGASFWSLDQDDFRGLCSSKPFPLLRAIREELF